jgi:hypothetical protein
MARFSMHHWQRTGMADTGVVNLDTDFVRPRRQNLDLLNGEVLAGFPGNCGLCNSQHVVLSSRVKCIIPL